MNNILHRAIILFLLVGLIGGCSPKEIIPTETSVTQSTSTSTQERLLFDFNGVPEGVPVDWQILFAPFDGGSKQPEVINAQAQQDHFIIDNQGTFSGLYAIHMGALPSPNLEISMDVSPDGANPMGVFLVCRYSESGWYQFRVSNGGSAIQLLEPKDGIYNVVHLAEGPGVFLDDGPHKLGAVCDGKQLSLLVDGREILSKEADFLNGGSFGFGVEAFDSPGGRKTFDNVSVQFLAGDIAAGPSITPTEQVAALPDTLTPAPVSTAVPTLRPTQIPQDQLVLYQTEFDDSDPTLADWKTFAYSFAENGFVTEGYDAYTVAGVYRIRTSDPNQGTNLRVFSIYDKELGTADVDISTRIKAGHMGLVCRYSEAGWYQFMVEPYNKWSIRLIQHDEAGQFHFRIISSGLYRGRETLRAECKGNRLTFYFDGEKLASLYDNTFPTGKVGILGWSFDKPGEIGMIDNFTIQRAQWNESTIAGPAPTPGADGVIYTTLFENLSALPQYWYSYTRTEALGPGVERKTIYYLNDFDPGTPDVEISADIVKDTMPRNLICRYSEDGWYEAGFLDTPDGKSVGVNRVERGAEGVLQVTNLSFRLVNQPIHKLTLTCAGNQIIASVNAEPFVYVEDNHWRSGRYGFSFTSSTPASPKSAFAGYTVRPAAQAVIQPSDTILTAVSDTWQEISSEWNMKWNLSIKDRVKIQDAAVLITTPGNNGYASWFGTISENSELNVDLEFLVESQINLLCRAGSPAASSFNIHSNGDWEIFGLGQATKGNSAAIHPDQNQLTIRCLGNQLTLIANGETLATVELSSYMPAAGKTGLDVQPNSQVQLNSLALKVMQGSPSLLPAPPLLNQVSLRTYQPGEAIYTWNIDDTLYRPNYGGRDWIWVFDINGANPPKRQENQIVVPAIKDLTVWTYRYQDLYDLPIEISAEATLAGKGGGIGLFCRYTARGRYEFLIQPDGKWYIRRNTSEWFNPRAAAITVLEYGSVENFTPENAQLSVACSGSDLVLTLNRVELGRAQATLYPEGQAGIFFDVFSEGSFTNLFIRRAE